MNLKEFNHNDSKYRIRLLSLDITDLDFVQKNTDHDILQLHDQYYSLQIYGARKVEKDTFTVFENVKTITGDLYSKLRDVFPGITIVGKETEVSYSDYSKEYNILDGYILKEHYKPPYDKGIVKYIVRTQVQYYDQDTKKIYNLMCYLPSGHRTLYGGAIYINHSTDKLDKIVIDIAKKNHKLNLIKCT